MQSRCYVMRSRQSDHSVRIKSHKKPLIDGNVSLLGLSRWLDKIEESGTVLMGK